MTDAEIIQERLDKYSALFDLDLDRGTPPLPPSEEGTQDPLQEYLQEAVSEPFNYLHSQEDTTWREVFKNSLMGFFSALLKAFLPLEREQQEEQKVIRSFFGASTDDKKKQWGNIVLFIQNKYTTNELNPYGYQRQLKETEPKRQEPVFEAMRQQWLQVSQEHLVQSECQLIENNRQEFQISFQEIGSEDYETLFSSRDIFFKYPVLKEIVEIIGRDKPQDKEEKDTAVTAYIPILLSHAQSITEVDGVNIGNTIQQALPSELVYLSAKDTEDVFFHRYATRQLQQMASKPPVVSQKKTKRSHTEMPRLIKGPIIVSVDTSGSMSGKPMKVAMSLLLQLLQMARRQKRACYLITYSVRAKAINLAHPGNWRLVRKFLREGFSGGTDGNEMLREAVATLQKKKYSMADVLIISDFEWYRSDKPVLTQMNQEKALGTKFYGLGIHAQDWSRKHEWLDRMWNIAKL